ncbi:hypothetical protein EVAR_56592_1 [Eumeta japonica]|uniref:Uncharacterized protein n=1 Tax=Eumeta variegata TaxID=151549 RepID=A0A4C1Z1N7_EUMVA|nr:hypothetical protein EVAR_56592_1 [Eumeta japonica]
MQKAPSSPTLTSSKARTQAPAINHYKSTRPRAVKDQTCGFRGLGRSSPTSMDTHNSREVSNASLTLRKGYLTEGGVA